MGVCVEVMSMYKQISAVLVDFFLRILVLMLTLVLLGAKCSLELRRLGICNVSWVTRLWMITQQHICTCTG